MDVEKNFQRKFKLSYFKTFFDSCILIYSVLKIYVYACIEDMCMTLLDNYVGVNGKYL